MTDGETGPGTQGKPGRTRSGWIFSLQHSRLAYYIDFALLYGTVMALTAFLILSGTHGRPVGIIILVPVGYGTWTLTEYLVHRYLLHGLQPFRSWHALHHRLQTDLIYAPTALTATAITGLVFLPAWLLGGMTRACAFTLGFLIGYLVYSITHHAVHHWRCDGAWLKHRKRWHSLHHRPSQVPGRYGVTTALWDHVFRSTAL